MPSIPSRKTEDPFIGCRIGIDPGVNGGIAVLSPSGRILVLEPMPATQKDIWEQLSVLGMYNTTARAYVECINTAAFGLNRGDSITKLYGSYRELTMVLSVLDISYETPTAKEWQSAMSITPRKKTEGQSKWKNRLRAKAQQLFPGFSKGITKERALKVCDALLIAEYCRRLTNGN